MSILIVAGRSLIGLFFILAGINKIANYSATLESMTAVGLPIVSVLLPLVILLEIGGGAVVLVGQGRIVLRATAIALAGFTLSTNVVFHRFWEIEGVIGQLELSLFFKNIVIAGALLIVSGLATRLEKS